MKQRHSILTLALSSLLSITPLKAYASIIDFSGPFINIGNVTLNQSGIISDFFLTGYTPPPPSYNPPVGGPPIGPNEGVVLGNLPAFSEITFSYTLPGLTNQGLLSSGGNVTFSVGEGQSSATAYPDGSGTSNTSGYINSIPINTTETILVLASASFGTLNGSTIIGSTSIVNNTPGIATFSSVVNFGSLLPISTEGTALSYSVFAVPLPATLPMFAALILGMFGLNRRKLRMLPSTLA